MRNNISNFLLALTGFLFLVCGSVVLILNCREIYYRDMRSQQLEDYLGLPEKEIRANYDVLIDYNLLTKEIDELVFPSFPMSEEGRIHFEEVREIFIAVQYLLMITAFLFAAGLIRKVRKGDYRFLKWMAIKSFTIPVILGILIGVCWEQVFVLFHKVFFRNDYWLFDPVTDPVILILPDVFFAHCAIAILLVILAGGAISMGVYLLLSKRSRRKEEENARRYSRYNRKTTTRR